MLNSLESPIQDVPSFPGLPNIWRSIRVLTEFLCNRLPIYVALSYRIHSNTINTLSLTSIEALEGPGLS